MSNKYRPSNGTEGMWFQDKFCDNCCKDMRHASNGGCQILLRTLTHDTKDEEYPLEWTYNKNGNPTCTAFKSRSEAAETRKRNKEDPNQLDLIKNQKDMDTEFSEVLNEKFWDLLA
jgi:hypothetical protein